MNPLEWSLTAASTGATVFGAVAWVSARPTCNFWGRVYSRAIASSQYALTFDDGPTRQSTEPILDTLGELNVRATFFVVGANVRRCPDLVARMHAEGHLVANHSLDHHRLSMFRGLRYWERQLTRTDRLVEEIIGVRPAMFRPPMGVKTWFNVCAAASAGHSVITWSRRAMDGVPTTRQRIINRVVPFTVGGDVVVLHDGVEPHSRRDPTPSVEAVKPLILQLRQRGLDPAPLDELLGLPAYAPGRIAAAAR